MMIWWEYISIIKSFSIFTDVPHLFLRRDRLKRAHLDGSLSLSRRVTEIDGMTSVDTQHIHHKLNAWWLFLFDFDADFISLIQLPATKKEIEIAKNDSIHISPFYQ